MLISQILFFIKCANTLRPTHEKSNTIQKRQIETFLKTWLFYNSSSRAIFWTGQSSQAVINGENQVKEHWYGNLSSAHYIMNPEILDEDFFLLDARVQVLNVFKFMQWNYTTRGENNRLRQLQKPDVFFSHYMGNANVMYEDAGITLTVIRENLLPILENFFNYPLIDSNDKNSIFEINSDQKDVLDSFVNNLTNTANAIENNISIVTILGKGCFYRNRNDNKTISFANLYRITMTALWQLFGSQEEIQEFLTFYNHQISDSGPYRNANTFPQNYGDYSFSIQITDGVYFPNTLWLSTRYNDEQRYIQLSKLFDFFGMSLTIYNYNLELRDLGNQIND